MQMLTSTSQKIKSVDPMSGTYTYLYNGEVYFWHSVNSKNVYKQGKALPIGKATTEDLFIYTVENYNE